MRISQETIGKIKDACDIVDVIGGFVNLKKKGANWWALSPFTDEKTPSFSVSAAKGMFMCFSTSKGGDSITFLMESEGMNYVEALNYLANKYGIEIEKGTPKEQEEYLKEQSIKESLFIVLKYTKDYFKNLLLKDSEGKGIGLSYFKERGYNSNTIEKFELGYSKNAWNNLETTAIKSGYKAEFLEGAGLIIRNKSNKTYDRFRGRVMFPIHDLSGKVLGFVARILKKDEKPKYLNSPETDVYHKSNVLYGLFQSKQDIRKQDECILVEGQTDVLSMYQGGIKNIVSSSGTALTVNQIKLIKRFTENITVIYDGDAAGIRASFKGIDLILEQGMNVKAVSLPKGEDPDSFINSKGSEFVKEYLKTNSKDFITFRAEMSLAEIENDPIKKAKVIREITETINKIPDVFKRTLFNTQLSKVFEIDEAVIIAESTRNGVNTNIKVQTPIPRKVKVQVSKPSYIKKVVKPLHSIAEQSLINQEIAVIEFLVNHGSKQLSDGEIVYKEFLNDIQDVEPENPTLKRVIDIYKEGIYKNRVIYKDDLMKDTDIAQVINNSKSNTNKISSEWKERFDIDIINEDERLSETLQKNSNRLKLSFVRTLIYKQSKEMKNDDIGIEKELLILKCMQQFKIIEMKLASELSNVYG